MIKLYHFPLCPFSRNVRLLLSEKSIQFELINENYWERSYQLMKLNPAVETPVIVDSNNIISDINAILEYLEEKYETISFLDGDPVQNAQIRRIAGWFNNKFYHEVSKHIINERIIKFYLKTGNLDVRVLKIAKNNVLYHIDYLDFLLKSNNWLAGDKLSFADVSAASQISVLDYLGDMPWERSNSVKEWYALIKSRPSFRKLLEDRVKGFTPSLHYANLDF
jgi:glutathione S-transferase